MEKSYYKSPIGILEIICENSILVSLKLVDYCEKSNIIFVLCGLWGFGHFWNWFLLILIAVFGFVFELYPLPQVWESGFWKVQNVRLLGLKCPVSFHKNFRNCRVSLTYLSFSNWYKQSLKMIILRHKMRMFSNC